MLKLPLFSLFLVVTCVFSSRQEIDYTSLNNSGVKIENVLRRNEGFYTQGLFFLEKDQIVHSSGLYGESVLALQKFPSLEIISKNVLNKSYFGEGCARCGEFIYQLTWQERKVLKYKVSDFSFVSSLEMDSEIKEGWGLSDTGKDNVLVATDGTNKMHFLDCNNDLKVTKSIEVKDELGIDVSKLNDLTYSKGFLFVNQYFSHKIYKVDPDTGLAMKEYDFSHFYQFEIKQNTLQDNSWNRGYVLNGIAYNKYKDNFLVTGKEWGYFYEITFN